jgi:hypothetical protein
MSRQNGIEISINIHRMSFDGSNNQGSWVNGVRKTTREIEERPTIRREIQDAGSEQKAGTGKRVTAEEMPVTTQNKIKGKRVLDREIHGALARQRQDTRGDRFGRLDAGG